MSKLLVLANEATAAQRRVYFHLVDSADGITAETGEAGGQPQVSSDGGAWTNTGIGTLSAIGNGRYYADLTQTLVQTAGTQIETRYKSANTAECPGDSVQVVAFDPNDAVRMGLTALPNANAGAAGGLPTDSTGKTSFNDIAATAIVSSGAITTSGGAVSTVTTATNVTTVNGLAAGVITASSIAADAITDAKVASDVTIASVTGAVGSVTGNVGGNVTGSVGSVVGAVGSVTGNVGGNVTGSVGSVATGGITAASLGADAITAAKVAADVSTEIATAMLAAGDIDGYTLEQALKLVLASAAAKLSGAATTTVVVRAADDSKDRITATVDASGNRTAVTLDATG